MTDRFIASPVVVAAYGLQAGNSFEDEFSSVSIENVIFDSLAYDIWTLENIVGISIADQKQYIKDTKIHSFTWYADYAKRFQFGMLLDWGQTDYNNAGLTEAAVAAMQVIKFAAVTKVPGGLMVKIATISGNDLAPLPAPQFTAFMEYMFRISAAGDNLFYTNAVADSLKLHLKVFYDPLVLDSAGKRLDGTNDTPLQSALDTFLKGIDFNRRFIPTLMVDALQQVEGIDVPHLVSAQSSYALLPYTDVPPEGVVPHAGYLRITNPANDLIIEWLPMTN